MFGVRARRGLRTCVVRAGTLGLAVLLALTPALGLAQEPTSPDPIPQVFTSTSCTSTKPDIEVRCRNAILVWKHAHEDVQDRLGVCQDDKADLRNLVEHPAPQPTHFWTGVGVGAGAAGIVALVATILLVR